jgi:hypothetical protein
VLSSSAEYVSFESTNKEWGKESRWLCLDLSTFVINSGPKLYEQKIKVLLNKINNK